MITDKEIEEAAKNYSGHDLDIDEGYGESAYVNSAFKSGAKWARDKMLETVVADLIEQNNYHAAKMIAYKATNEKYRKALENCNFYNEPKSASIAREALKEGEE